MKYILRGRNNKNNIYVDSPKSLNFFYDNFFGRIILKILISKTFTKLVGLYMNSKLSVHKINRFIKDNNVNMKEYEKKKYVSYNDFFTRKIILSNRKMHLDNNIFISPCDSALSVYKISNNLKLNIKNYYYSIETLINKRLLEDYIEGYALVFRLDVTDYHRYCYIDSGYQEENIHINGIFHTVQSISLNHYNYYKTNDREYTILHTNNFNDIVQVEIGAMCVGKIKNIHSNYKYKKGEEKGYFEFGGSTIVLLVKKDIIEIDKDILNNSNDSIETIVKYGEKIGKTIKN